MLQAEAPGARSNGARPACGAHGRRASAQSADVEGLHHELGHEPEAFESAPVHVGEPNTIGQIDGAGPVFGCSRKRGLCR